MATSLIPDDRWTALWQRAIRVLVVYGVMVAVGAGVAARVGAMGVVRVRSTDLYEYGVIGQNVSDGRGYVYYSVDGQGRVAIDDAHTGRPLPSAYMPPGYTAVVAVVMSLAHGRAAIWMLRVLNLLAAALAIWLISLVGKEVYGPLAGSCAALVLALYPVAIYQATQTSASNVYLPVEIAVLLLVLRAARSSHRRAWMAAGLALGLLSLFRTEAEALVPVILIWGLWRGWRSREGRTLVCAGLFVVAACIPIGTWMARNAVALGAFEPTLTTSGGFNLWIGNHAGASGSQKSYAPESPALQAQVDAVARNARYELNRDSAYLHAALTYMKTHPAAVVALDAKKVAMTLTYDHYDRRGRSPVYLASWLLLLGLGLVGMAWGRPPPAGRAILYAYLGFGLVLPAVFFTLARYTLTVAIPLMVFAGAALARILLGGPDEQPAIGSH